MAELNLIELRERIQRCADLSPAERNLIISALAIGQYADKHKYPASYKKGANKYADLAFALLDQFPPDAMKLMHRFALAGMIAGALQAAHDVRA